MIARPGWIALATASALLSAAAAVSQKRILFRASALEFSFLVSVVILLLSLFVPLTSNVMLDGRTLAILGGKSVLGGAAFLCVMLALEREPISHALPLMGLTPAATGVLAGFLLHEPLHGAEWAGLALMLAGTWALEMRSGAPAPGAARDLLRPGRLRFMWAAIALFALSSVADKLLVAHMKVPPFTVLFWQHVVYCALFGAMLLVRRADPAVLAARAKEHLPMLVLVAVLTIGYRWFQLAATKTGPVALVLAVKRTSIVYATFFGGRIFKEQRLAGRVIACVLIVAAGFLFLGRD